MGGFESRVCTDVQDQAELGWWKPFVQTREAFLRCADRTSLSQILLGIHLPQRYSRLVSSQGFALAWMGRDKLTDGLPCSPLNIF
jgi:hypothetical protein